MICVYKIKMVEEQWLQLKLNYLVVGINLWWRGDSSEGMRKYLAWKNSETIHGLYQGAHSLPCIPAVLKNHCHVLGKTAQNNFPEQCLSGNGVFQ